MTSRTLATPCPPPCTPAWTTPWLLLGLVLPLVWYTVRAVGYVLNPEIPYDTTNTYLPLAQRLLQDAGALFASPDSLKVPPGTYIYMALAGADINHIRALNVALALTSITLLFFAAHQLAGRAAGASAAWLYALSPTLAALVSLPMAEPPFLFLLTVWIWACATLGRTRALGWRAWGLALLAGIAMGLTTLTRGTYVYWIPIAVVAFAAAARWGGNADMRSAMLKMAVAHTITLAMVGTYMARNQSTFEAPILGTGTGIALYLGNNPILAGYEPPYFDLFYDPVTVTGSASHLSIEGDQRLKAIALRMLSDTPLARLAAMYTQKAGALLFYSRAHLRPHLLNERAWRIALVLLALVGAWQSRRHWPVWVVASVLVYQWAVHVPVLYNPRYSNHSLDLPLTLLAALGVGWWWEQKARRKAMAIAVLALAIVAGAWHQRHSAPLLPELANGPHRPLATATPAQLTVDGWNGNPFETLAATTAQPATITWTLAEPRQILWSSVLQLELAQREGRCNAMRIISQQADGKQHASHVSLRGWRASQPLAWGVSSFMSPPKATRYQIVLDCPAGVRMQFKQLGLYDISMGRHYTSTP